MVEKSNTTHEVASAGIKRQDFGHTVVGDYLHTRKLKHRAFVQTTEVYAYGDFSLSFSYWWARLSVLQVCSSINSKCADN